MTEREKGSVPQSGRGAFSSGLRTAAAPGTERRNNEERVKRRNPAEDTETESANRKEESAETEENAAVSEPSEETPALCPICGNSAEGFGSFPIREGLLCGDCAGKLSEWFPCRPDTAAADIRAQLRYREENRRAAGAFHTSKLLWSLPCVALDSQNGTFQITAQRGRSANPDILSFRQIRGCQEEVAEQRKELFRPGREHYRPRRYEYRFEIYVRVLVDHPFFHEMRFRLHDRPIVVSDRMVHASTAGKVVKSPEYQRYRRAGEEICAALQKAMEQAREEPQQEPGTAEMLKTAETVETPEKAETS